ncbi:MAG: type II toxin-antitoxin system VapC family toxin [Thermodesulfobacteriota bacterium]
MTTYYLDTSALIKRYVDEAGSDWLRATVSRRGSASILVANLAIVEVTSALMRRVRDGSLTSTDYASLQSAFRNDLMMEYSLMNVVDNTINRAKSLIEQHPLRGYDAVHLATALVANEQLVLHNLSPIIFLSADDRLNDAASAEGLAVDNPNNHP